MIFLQEGEEGDQLAEEGLENLARFNEDMAMISRNVFEIYNLFETLDKDNIEKVERLRRVEQQTIELEEIQAENLKLIDQIAQFEGALGLS